MGMIFVPIILILVISEITGLTERQYKEEILKNNYKAKIDCIFIDRYNHSEPTILLDNKKTISNYFIFEKNRIRIGDSLIKSKNSFSIIHKRNNSILNKVNIYK